MIWRVVLVTYNLQSGAPSASNGGITTVIGDFVTLGLAQSAATALAAGVHSAAGNTDGSLRSKAVVIQVE